MNTTDAYILLGAMLFAIGLIGFLARRNLIIMLGLFGAALFYGDGVDIGHFSPIGAYDVARDLVLMLDVYKKDYEPMWAPLPRLARAMATQSRKTGEPRGYAVVKRRK